MGYINILWFADGQVKPKVPIEHFAALGRMAREKKPDLIINGGDHWDLPSLSYYDRFKQEAEGRRLRDDLTSGNLALAAFDKELAKSRSYAPRKVFLKGNHEYRLDRLMDDQPWLFDYFPDHEVYQMDDGWERRNFLTVYKNAGINFCHYFRNRTSPRAISGTMQNRLNQIGGSFVQGHQQVWLHERRPLAGGGAHSGLVCGAFYQHHEKYLSVQLKDHYRGAAMLWGAEKGDFDVEQWSIKRLLREYG